MQPIRPCSSLTAASSARLAGAEPSYPTTMCRNPADGAPCAASTRGFHYGSSCTACCRSASSMAMPRRCWRGFRRPGARRGEPGSAHEGHELLGHDDDGPHHVAVLVFEDVAVVHVAAAVGLEADGELDDLVGLTRTVAVVSRSPIPLPGTVTAIGRRARTWKGSRWTWIGWVSPVRLISCHTSQRPSIGKNVAASSKWTAAVRRRAAEPQTAAPQAGRAHARAGRG